MNEPTEYELLTWKGRKLCDAYELGMGYCGSVPLEIHVKQMRDINDWVQNKSIQKEWEEAGKLGFCPNDKDRKIKKLEERIKELEDEQIKHIVG